MLDVSQLEDDGSGKLPPVHLWKPAFCGDMDMLIKANGQWIHEGGLIKRPAMVKMFSRILWLEDEDYFLVTPVEKVRIQVEDAPFLVTHMSVMTNDDGVTLAFTTSVGDHLVLGQDDISLWMDDYQGEAHPYISVRYGMKALIHRNIFYDLVELGQEKEINGEMHLCVTSNKQYFSLGKLSE
jgi:hypothetical protein